MATTPPPSPEKRASGAADGLGEASATWRLTAHCCRVCFARILARPDAGETLYRCSNCGLEARSTRPETLCACGITLRGGRNAGLRCVPNPAPTPECPSLIVVEEVASGKPSQPGFG